MPKISFLCMLLIISLEQFAQETRINQEVISTAGNGFKSNSIILDWTLGEIAVTTIQGENRLISQGFHQPKLVITNLEKLESGLTTIQVYPNPTNDIIQMDISFGEIHSISVMIADVSGKIVWKNQYYGNQLFERTSLSHFPNGIYFLTFIVDELESKQTFKIHKTN